MCFIYTSTLSARRHLHDDMCVGPQVTGHLYTGEAPNESRGPSRVRKLGWFRVHTRSTWLSPARDARASQAITCQRWDRHVPTSAPTHLTGMEDCDMLFNPAINDEFLGKRLAIAYIPSTSERAHHGNCNPNLHWKIAMC